MLHSKRWHLLLFPSESRSRAAMTPGGRPSSGLGQPSLAPRWEPRLFVTSLHGNRAGNWHTGPRLLQVTRGGVGTQPQVGPAPPHDDVPSHRGGLPVLRATRGAAVPRSLVHSVRQQRAQVVTQLRTEGAGAAPGGGGERISAIGSLPGLPPDSRGGRWGTLEPLGGKSLCVPRPY